MSYGQMALTTLQVAAVRMPTFFAQAHGALALGELARRGCVAVVRGFFSLVTTPGKPNQNPEPSLSDNVWSYVGSYLCPFGDETKYPTRELAKTCAIACFLGSVGSALVTKAFGDAPPIYNRVLSVITNNIRISNEPWVVQTALGL